MGTQRDKCSCVVSGLCSHGGTESEMRSQGFGLEGSEAMEVLGKRWGKMRERNPFTLNGRQHSQMFMG